MAFIIGVLVHINLNLKVLVQQSLVRQQCLVPVLFILVTKELN